MWVIQELVFGRRTDEASSIWVLLGSQTVLWKDLVCCCRWLQTNPWDLSANCDLTTLDAVKLGVEKVLFLQAMALPSEDEEQDERPGYNGLSQHFHEYAIDSHPTLSTRSALLMVFSHGD